MARTRKTRKNRSRGRVLDVRSAKHVKQLESLMASGPLTIVFVKAQWCGACHRFNDEVWSSLTKLKNKHMNLASVDSEVIGQTSLANVPRKFYPTLLLVGKDKKPATFLDEDGTPTNSMPRNGSLEEDREALSSLVQSPRPSDSPMASSSMASSPMASPFMAPPMASSSMASPMSPPSTPSPMNDEASEASEGPNMSTLTRSPYTSKPSTPFVSSVPVSDMPSSGFVRPSIPRSSMPPDIGSDLVASQTRASSGTAGVISESMRNTRQDGGGGSLLRAIRKQTASLKAMLSLRSAHTKKHRTVKRR